MSKALSMNGGNRSTNRFSALQSLAAEQDTEIEDELARGEPLNEHNMGPSAVPGKGELVGGGGLEENREEVYAGLLRQHAPGRNYAVWSSCHSRGMGDGVVDVFRSSR